MQSVEKKGVRLVLAACVLLAGTLLLAQEPDAAAQAIIKAYGMTNDVHRVYGIPVEEPETNSSAPAGAGPEELRDQRGPTLLQDGRTQGGLSRSGVDRQVIVVFGRDVELKAGDSAETVVVIGGSAKIHGRVREAVVAIGGDVEVDGKVGDAVVAVMGNVRAGQGADLQQDVVAVMGDVKVDPKATIHGDAVAVGGSLEVAEGASVQGHRQEVGLPRMEWLKSFVLQCVFKLRPLAPQVGWVWAIAGVFFLFYLLIAAAFPRPVQACVEDLTQRPATTFFLGLLAKLLVPLVTLILAVTGIGLIVVPFIGVALFLGSAVGKVALLEWLGMKIGRQFGVSAFQKPLAAFLIGTIILTLFYTVWVVGLLVYIVFSIWGLGVAVTAAFSGMRRELPDRPVTGPPLTEPPVMAAGAGGMPGMPATSGGAASQAESATATMGAAARPTLPDAWSYPKAGFWERMAAAFLDVVLVGILTGLVRGSPLSEFGLPMPFLVILAYFAGLWTWKGTTVGGIVLGLKVARLDGQPLTFIVALVRALSAAFSILVFFLGFLWIAWDRDKQGWHDKIAGTVVLRLPRGTPLVCL